MGEVIQFVPRPNVGRKSQVELEAMAIDIINHALIGAPLLYESSLGYIDTSPHLDEPA